MKKKDLTNLILKEIRSLKEGFQNPIAREIKNLKGLDKGWTDFFTTMSTQYGIAWDKIAEDSQALRGPIPVELLSRKQIMNPNFMIIWVNKKNVLSVTQGGKALYWSSKRMGTKYGHKISPKERGSYSNTYTPLGTGGRGFLQIGALKENADEVYIIDLSELKNTTGDIRTQRRSSREDALALKDPKEIKRENNQRYQEILAQRVGSRDKVDNMVREIMNEVNSQLEKGMTNFGKDRMGVTIKDKGVKLSNLGRFLGRVFDHYERYAQYERDKEKAEKGGGLTFRYYEENARSEALNIKELYNELFIKPGFYLT